MRVNHSTKIVRKLLSKYDFNLVILVLFTCAFGVIMVFSASSYRAEYYYNDSAFYFKRQGLFFIVGTVLMVLTSLIDYRVFCKKIKFIKIRPVVLLYLICIGLHWFVFFAGYGAGGSSRWIQLGGGFNFQPSELSKVCFVLAGAFVAERKKHMLNTGSTVKNIGGISFMYVLFAPILVPVALQNFSSAVILVAIITCMFFCISMDKRYFIVVLIVLALGAIPMILLKGYRSERLMNFWNPDTMDPSGQIMQGLYAIASGGLIGKGFGNSVQKLGNMPEVHTDMIFTIICEELGIIGGIMIIGLFLLILWRIFMIALRAPDLYGSLIAIGVFAQVAIQVVMNIAVVTNTIPATGVPLPFISYGGSNLIILMVEMGIVLSISNRTYESIADGEDE